MADSTHNADNRPAPVARPGSRSDRPVGPPFVEVEGLIASYGDKKVLDGIHLSAHRNEITVILGTSGCGKSTLLRHLAGLQEPSAGRVLIGGRDLYKCSEDEQEKILKDLGMSFQGGALFNSLALWENVAMPIVEHTGADMATAKTLAIMKLSLVGLERSAYLLPAEISGGMRKRAAIARALALDPTLLLFDEPSAGLDPVTSRELDELILRLKAQFGMAIVVVSHELGSIETIADQAIMLDAGKVLAAGPLEQVRSSKDKKVRAFFDRELTGPADTGELLTQIIEEGEQGG